MILNNLKHMWRQERFFLTLICLIQAFAVFSMLFMGIVIKNNALVANERTYETLTVYVRFTEDVTYSEIKQMCFDISEGKYKGLVEEFKLYSVAPPENEKIAHISLLSFFGIEDGKYTAGKTATEFHSKSLKSGRIISDDEMNSDAHVALTIDYPYDTISIFGEEYEVVGALTRSLDEENTDAENNEYYSDVFVTPAILENAGLNSLEIGLNRILVEAEQNYITDFLDSAVPGRYEITFGKVSDVDMEAALKTTNLTQVFSVLVVAGALLMIYVYIFTKRRYRMAVWRLTGCSRVRSGLITFGEIIVTSVFSLALGSALFVLLAKTVLIKIYKYIPGLLTKEYVVSNNAILLAVIVALALVLAVKCSDKSIRRMLKTV